MAPSSNNQTSKPPKLSTKKKSIKIDRISHLPDPLLCCILSFLTTKEAVATSILSKRWQYLWTWVPILNFDERDIFDEDMSFGDIVTKVMLSRKTRCIRAFRMQWFDDNPYVDNSSQLQTWICSAVLGNVEELDLFIQTDQEEDFQVPPSLFSCKTLTILKLKSQFALNVASSVELPRLKVLHLLTVVYEGKYSFSNLISACPVLDELVIQRCDGDKISRYEIFSSTLTTLVLDHTSIESDLYYHSVTINTPALKYLGLINPSFNEPPVIELNNLVEADVTVCGQNGKSIEWTYILEIIYDIRNVKFL